MALVLEYQQQQRGFKKERRDNSIILYEFYLSDAAKGQAFEALCTSFYELGAKVKRVVDGENGSAVYAVSRNPKTNWVQLLVDDNATPDTLKAIETQIAQLNESANFKKAQSSKHAVAPVEFPKTLNVLNARATATGI